MPKRLEMTFTSSGWDTSLGMGRLFLLGFCAIGVQDCVRLVASEFVVEVVVYLNGWGPRANPYAFDFFEREEAVGGDALVADAELFFEVLEEIVSAAQHATDVGADLNVVFAHR